MDYIAGANLHDGVKAWKLLLNRFEILSVATIRKHVHQYFTLKLLPKESTDDLISRADALRHKLSPYDMAPDISDFTHCSTILSALPNDWQSQVQHLYNDANLRIDNLSVQLRSIAANNNHQEVITIDDARPTSHGHAFAVQQTQTNNDYSCNRCDNHCPRPNGKCVYLCYICKTQGHGPNMCFKNPQGRNYKPKWKPRSTKNDQNDASDQANTATIERKSKPSVTSTGYEPEDWVFSAVENSANIPTGYEPEDWDFDDAQPTILQELPASLHNITID